MLLDRLFAVADHRQHDVADDRLEQLLLALVVEEDGALRAPGAAGNVLEPRRFVAAVDERLQRGRENLPRSRFLAAAPTRRVAGLADTGLHAVLQRGRCVESGETILTRGQLARLMLRATPTHGGFSILYSNARQQVMKSRKSLRAGDYAASFNCRSGCPSTRLQGQRTRAIRRTRVPPPILALTK